MRQRLLLSAAVFAVGVALASSSNAQYQDSRSPQNQFVPTPTVTPYLELLRGGAGPGFNYQTQVRPRLELKDRLNKQRINNENTIRRQDQINYRQQRETEAIRQQQQQQFIPSPFTQQGADRITGAAQSIRPTGQGRPINYGGAITGHSSVRLRPQRSNGQPYFAPITGRGQRRR